jgi:hypothetical protein
VEIAAGEDEEALDVVAAEHDEPQRAPVDGVEQQVDRAAQPDAVQLHGQLQQLGG